MADWTPMADRETEVRAAIQRLLNATPERSHSITLSVNNLAREAHVPTSYLTLTRPDLKAEFTAAVDARDRKPSRKQETTEQRLAKAIDERDYWMQVATLLAEKLAAVELTAARQVREVTERAGRSDGPS